MTDRERKENIYNEMKANGYCGTKEYFVGMTVTQCEKAKSRFIEYKVECGEGYKK